VPVELIYVGARELYGGHVGVAERVGRQHADMARRDVDAAAALSIACPPLARPRVACSDVNKTTRFKTKTKTKI